MVAEVWRLLARPSARHGPETGLFPIDSGPGSSNNKPGQEANHFSFFLICTRQLPVRGSICCRVHADFVWWRSPECPTTLRRPRYIVRWRWCSSGTPGVVVGWQRDAVAPEPAAASTRPQRLSPQRSSQRRLSQRRSKRCRFNLTRGRRPRCNRARSQPAGGPAKRARVAGRLFGVGGDSGLQRRADDGRGDSPGALLRFALRDHRGRRWQHRPHRRRARRAGGIGRLARGSPAVEPGKGSGAEAWLSVGPRQRGAGAGRRPGIRSGRIRRVDSTDRQRAGRRGVWQPFSEAAGAARACGISWAIAC